LPIGFYRPFVQKIAYLPHRSGSSSWWCWIFHLCHN